MPANAVASPTVRKLVLDHLGAAGAVGATDEQIAEAIGVDRGTTVSARSRCARDGWAEQKGQRPTRSGSSAAVWVLTEDGRESWAAGTDLADEELTEDEALALLGRTANGQVRKLYARLGERGKMTDAQMREALNSPGSGPRNALQVLLEGGLAHAVGKAETRGKKARQYAQVPRYRRRIRAAAEKHLAQAKRAKPKQGGGTLAGARLAQLRRMEPGQFSEWQRNRKRLLEETVLLTQLEPEMFWECARPDEVEWVLEEVIELILWAENVAMAALQRQVDDGVRRKIEKATSNLSGRTDGEIRNAEQLATVLRKRLPPT